MYSLFALLFKKSYWRTLLSASTWIDVWKSLKRAHKDSRARKFLRQIAVLCLVPFLCIAYLAWAAGIGLLYFLPLVFLGIWLYNRHRTKNSAPLHIAPQPEPIHRVLTAEDRIALRARFSDLTLLLSIFLDRAGSEAYLRNKVLPDGVEVVSRRIHIDLLKSRNLWDNLPTPDRDAMMMPDGAWEPSHIAITANRCFEPLRLMRWILRIDHRLPLVGQQLRFDFRTANELVRNPEKFLTPGDAITEQSLIETARDAAHQYLLRCYAEEVARGYITPDEAETTEWANRLSSSMSGKQSVDFLIDASLVSEATREQLEATTQLSRYRLHFLNWILSIENETNPAQPDPPDLDFAIFPSPDSDSESESESTPDPTQPAD